MQRFTTAGLAVRLFGGDPARALALLRAAWPGAVGPELARRTRVVALEGDTVRVGVPDAGWRKVLLKMRGEILGRLARRLGDLAPRRMSFAEGLRVPDLERKEATPLPPPGPAPEAVVLAAARIADTTLRAHFLESSARYLRRFSKPVP